VLGYYGAIEVGSTRAGRRSVVYQKQINGAVYYTGRVIELSNRKGTAERMKGKSVWRVPPSSGNDADLLAPPTTPEASRRTTPPHLQR